jgi:hypothetical protein
MLEIVASGQRRALRTLVGSHRGLAIGNDV